MGTAQLACPALTALAASPAYRVVAVVTQPDRPKGRALQLQPSPVRILADNLQLPLLQPNRVRDPAFLNQLTALWPDLIVVAAYGQILPPSLLALPRHGCLNIHASLLPKYRGAAPIQWALLNGDTETGVTLMKIAERLDTGDILAQRSIPIGPDDTAPQLHNRLAQLGADLLLDTLPVFLDGRAVPRPQPEQDVFHARKITKEDGRIPWASTAAQIRNRLRALTPWPGLYSHLPESSSHTFVKIWDATPVPEQGVPGTILRVRPDGIVVACGQDALRILSLQLEGGRPMTAREFLAGHPLNPGDRFSNPQEPLQGPNT